MNTRRPGRWGSGVILLLTVSLASCVAPSVTETDFRHDVANTAVAMASVGESALLTVEVAARGSAPGPYVSLRLTEAEHDAGNIIDTFSRVQPPSPRSDRLRVGLLEQLERVAAVLEELRIAAKRDDHHLLPEIAEPLRPALEELGRLARATAS